MRTICFGFQGTGREPWHVIRWYLTADDTLMSKQISGRCEITGYWITKQTLKMGTEMETAKSFRLDYSGDVASIAIKAVLGGEAGASDAERTFGFHRKSNKSCCFISWSVVACTSRCSSISTSTGCCRWGGRCLCCCSSLLLCPVFLGWVNRLSLLVAKMHRKQERWVYMYHSAD